jgi:hypothetical protein
MMVSYNRMLRIGLKLSTGVFFEMEEALFIAYKDILK